MKFQKLIEDSFRIQSEIDALQEKMQQAPEIELRAIKLILQCDIPGRDPSLKIVLRNNDSTYLKLDDIRAMVAFLDEWLGCDSQLGDVPSSARYLTREQVSAAISDGFEYGNEAICNLLFGFQK